MRVKHIIDVVNSTHDLYKLDNIRFIISSTADFEKEQKEAIYKAIDDRYEYLSNKALAVCSDINPGELGLEDTLLQ